MKHLTDTLLAVILSAPAAVFPSALSHAQEQTVYKRGHTMLENTLPPSPEPTSAVKYVDVPISYSQGLARLDIPVHTIRGRELTIPVGLSYTSSGIRLDEVAGVAGLGWTLNAGGCVTRTVVDMPDEFSSTLIRHKTPSGVLLESLEDTEDTGTAKVAYLRDIVWHRVDSGLDRYSYNVCGLSGSFVITDDGSVFHLSGDGAGITYERDPASGSVSSFTIKGPDGVTYVLDVTETGSHDGSGDEPFTPTSGQPDRWSATTAWYLRTATSRSGLETATFSYTEPLKWTRKIRAGGTSISVRRSAVTEERRISPSLNYIVASYGAFALSSISLSGFSVSMEYSTGTGGDLHRHLAGQGDENYPYMLCGIEVSYSGDDLLKVEVGTGCDSYDGRVVLKSLRFRKGGELDDKWDFSYSAARKRVSSLSQDWFGYYNGEDDASPGTRGGTCPFSMDQTWGTIRLTNGTPDPEKAAYMSLLSADHDGAKTTFKYEGNAVNAPGGDTLVVSVGVRVGSVIVSDNGNTVRTRTFTYGEPCPSGPVFPQAGMYITTSAALSESESASGIMSTGHVWNISVHDDPVAVGPSIKDTRVVYGMVTEEVGEIGRLPEPTNPFLKAITPARRPDLSRYRIVRHFSTDDIRPAETSTISRFPSVWLSDYRSASTVPSSVDPMLGIRQGYVDGKPSSAAPLVKMEEYSSEDGSEYRLLSSTDYTYAPLSRGMVVTDYRATQVMRRIIEGDLRLDDIYHFAVRTSSEPGRVPVSERRVEYHEDGNEETTVSTSYVPRPDLSFPARPSSVTLSSGGETRTVSYTYPDTWSGGGSWAAGLLSAHALTAELRKEYFIGKAGTPTASAPRKTETVEYSGFRIGDYDRLLPSSRVELTDGVESWREDILARDCLGNVSSFKSTGNPVTTVLWSWNGLYPLLVMENASASDFNDAVKMSNFADMVTKTGALHNAMLRIVSKLRESEPLSKSHIHTFMFSPGLGLTSSTDPSGVRTSYEYDTHGRLAFVRDCDGNAVTGYTYNLMNDGDGHLSTRTRTYRDSLGGVWSEDVRWWNTLGLRLEDISISAAGDGRDLVTSYGSDFMLHDDAKVWLPYPAETSSGTFQTDAADAAMAYHSSVSPYRLTRHERSASGRVKYVVLPGHTSAHTTTYGYGVSTGVPYFIWKDNGVSEEGTRDPAGLSRETVTDPDGAVTEVVCDHIGNTILTRSGSDTPTYYVYDTWGRLRAVAGGNVHVSDTLSMWRYSYDGRDRLSSKGAPGSARTFYTYDGEDRIRTESRGDGTLEYEYDDFGRMTRTLFRKGDSGAAVQEERVYDAYPDEAATLIRLATGGSGWDGPVKGMETYSSLAVIDAGGVSSGTVRTARLYDRKARPVWTVSEYPDGAILKERLEYDFAGDVTARTVTHTRNGFTDSLVTRLAYDVRGRLRSESSSLFSGGSATASVSTECAYDGLGRSSGSTSRADGGPSLEISDGYTLQQWLSSRSVSLGGADVFAESLGYDVESQIEGIEPLFSGRVSRMTEVWSLPGSATSEDALGFAYDGSGRLSKAYGVDSRTDYSYDSRGNLTSVDRRTAGMETYRYSGDMLTGFRAVGADEVSFAHDGFARMTSDGLAGTKIVYNHLDRPSSVRSGESTALYTYLADGTKVSAIAGDGSGLLYRGPFVYRRSASGDLSLESAACSAGRLTSSGALLHVTDHLGSVRAVVGGKDGAVYAADDYSPYGTVSSILAAGSAPEPPGGVTLRDGFTGQESQAPDFGIPYVDFGARLYSPALRRWLTPDPLSEKYYGVSPYAYCLGNPIIFIDPNGKWITLYHDGHEYRFQDNQFLLYQTEGDYAGSFVPTSDMFIQTISSAFLELSKVKTGKSLIDYFSNDKNNAYIQFDDGNNVINLSGICSIIYLNKELTGETVPTEAGMQQMPFWLVVGHELSHRMDYIERGDDASKIWLDVDNGIKNTEIQATHYENLMREEAGLPLRTHYATIGTGQKAMPYEPSRLINRQGKSVILPNVYYTPIRKRK